MKVVEAEFPIHWSRGGHSSNEALHLSRAERPDDGYFTIRVRERHVWRLRGGIWRSVTMEAVSGEEG